MTILQLDRLVSRESSDRDRLSSSPRVRGYVRDEFFATTPLDVLEARERARGERETGLARWQYARVHRDISYDLEVDATTATPTECARLIRDAFGL